MVYAAPYTIEALAGVRIGSDSGQPNFQQAESEIELRDAPFESARLRVELETTCFPFDGWQTNPPPAGQRWPADCDAFDRNFEISLDDPAEGTAGPPGLELVRAITPFGGPLTLDVDITDVANGSPGKHRLFVHITTWSDPAGQSTGSSGGWNVSARIEVVPGPAPRRVLAVRPLFYDSVTEPGGEPIEFETPAGTLTTRLEYRATGHGGVTFAPGCGATAPADEFCRRQHALIADGAPLSDVEPWRDDCDTLCTIARQNSAGGGFDYCAENPCGAISSVRAERAGWCPGSVSEAFSFEHAAFAAAGRTVVAGKFRTWQSVQAGACRPCSLRLEAELSG